MTCTTVDGRLVSTSETYPHVRAVLVADSRHAAFDQRILTVQVRGPRWLLAEINTHGRLSKSSQSSRAVPLKVRIPQARNNPVTPSRWGGEQRGMVAAGPLSGWRLWAAKAVWRSAAWFAAAHAYALAKVGLHKQWTARVIEPYLVVETVLTATEWDNFFALRTAPDAQPEFQELAKCIREIYDNSKPTDRDYHTPYVEEHEHPDPYTRALVSAARCARVSYFRSDGQKSRLDADLELVKTLLTQGHMNPFSHQARVGTALHGADLELVKMSQMDPIIHPARAKVALSGVGWGNSTYRGNFGGPWTQFRKLIPGEGCKTNDPVDLARIEAVVRHLWCTSGASTKGRSQ